MTEHKSAADMARDTLNHLEEKYGAPVAEVKARLEELEQRVVRGGGPGEGFGMESKSWGAQVADHESEIRNFAEDRRFKRSINFELKNISSASGSAGGLIVTDRDSLNGLPQRRMTVRSLLNVRPVTSNSVEYPNQVARTNNANTVAEGTAKPWSDYTWEQVQVPIRTIAHLTAASVQILEDVPQLQDMIDTELRYGLNLKEEAQLLTGDGTGQNLKGLVTGATVYAAPFDPAGVETMIDTLGLAILQNALAEEPATGIVVHPSDWMRMRLLKDADGKYLLGDPGAQVAPQLFGLPVVPTQAMTIDKFLVGNFPRAATLYDRHAPRVEISTEHANFFELNMCAIRCEERIGLAIKNAKALTYGDFGNVA
jgi:HK97 family phage major capsid protein